VTIPVGVTSIGDSAFYDCTSLEAFSVAAENVNYSSANGLLLNKEGTILLQGVNGEVAIPDSVTSIGDSAFSGCGALTGVSIPDSVMDIGNSAFSGCRGLTGVSMPDGVTVIGDYAFYECTGLTSVSMGDSVTFIGNGAFCDCSGLTDVTIPDSVTYVGFHAFYECTGLKTLSVPGTWEGTEMLADVWGWDGKPEECVVVYRASGAFPPAQDEEEVAAALAGAADERLEERIRSVEEYDAFRAWTEEKALDAGAVKSSKQAWISYALGAEGLFKNEPEIVLDGMSALSPGAKRDGGAIALEVTVTVSDGGNAVAVDEEKVSALFEATSNPRDWTGKAKIPVTGTPLESEGPSMKFKVQPDGETVQKAFLRLAP